MTTSNTLVYSIEAAKRILNLKSGVSKVVEWAWVVLVVGKNFSKFMSKKLFKKHFVDHKKEQAKTIEIVQDSRSQFTAKSGTKVYQLEATQTAIRCTCEDYRIQLGTIGQAVCKHGYGVLNTLGFDSLSSYIADRKHSPQAQVSRASSMPQVSIPNSRSSSEPRKKGRSVD